MAHSSQRGQAIIISDHFFADLLCDSYHGGLAIGARAAPWTMQSDGIYITEHGLPGIYGNVNEPIPSNCPTFRGTVLIFDPKFVAVPLFLLIFWALANLLLNLTIFGYLCQICKNLSRFLLQAGWKVCESCPRATVPRTQFIYCHKSLALFYNYYIFGIVLSYILS